MASTKSKPAATKEAQPAAKTQKPAVGVGIKEMAEDLGKSPKVVRAAIRRHLGGPQVGQGGRYTWPSRSDKGYKELLAALKNKDKATQTEESE